MSNAPVIKNRDLGISTAVFEWTNQDGKKTYSVSLQRSYKKKDEEKYTEETINMYPEDLLKVANLLARTYNDLLDYRAANKPVTTPTTATPSSVDSDNIPF